MGQRKPPPEPWTRKRREMNLYLKNVFGMDPEVMFRQVERLSPGEMQMIELIALGYTRDQVMSELNIMLTTWHRRRADIRKKLGVHTSSGIVRFYLCWKLIKEQDRRKEIRRVAAEEIEVDW